MTDPQAPNSEVAARNPDHRPETLAIHAGEPYPRHWRAVIPPIYQCSVFEVADDDDDASDEHGEHEANETAETSDANEANETTDTTHPSAQPRGEAPRIQYPRLGNVPNQTVVAKKLAHLEGAEAGLVTASGMAAVSASLLSVLKPGDHVLAQDALYGGTHQLMTKDLPAYGIEVDFVDGNDPKGWAQKLKSSTRVFYTESITNPILKVADHHAVVEFSRQNGLVSMIDNTFASPVNFRPVEIGYDLSIHSATKYLNGHSDLVAGAVVGHQRFIDGVQRFVLHFGACLDAHACFLLHRGMKTLALRVRHQSASALILAQHLERHPMIARVYYPGLLSHPTHDLARSLLTGYGGMMAFEHRDGVQAARAMTRRLKLAVYATSLGGVESIVTLPSRTSHLPMSPEERRRAGIADGLVRLSVGIENVDDLVEDFDQALRVDA
ncbi:MAG: aminotransferase class I/II-fold pyridoxal phosphate-dependent enzyme [Deltaproteobacteria bacterium]|nr:aminotransferase class I/II-fold pyridoxal phosphate-dependent enzyme [Deltaproteobacteria bacterium]